MKIERSKEIGVNIAAIIENMNAITEEELEELLKADRREQAIGPLLHPTAYIRGGRFDILSETLTVAGEILRFKRTVKGIGKFK